MENRENPCLNCDSTSMEMCLLIRHCENWVIRGKDKKENETSDNDE